jgi:hypothetical protein
MPAPIIDDELWELIEPLLPPPKPRRKRYPGRLPVSDRAALWSDLLASVARLAAGRGWDKLHGLLLDKLRESGQIDFSYAAVDSSSVRAFGAGQKLGQTPPIAHDQDPNTTSS